MTHYTHLPSKSRSPIDIIMTRIMLEVTSYIVYVRRQIVNLCTASLQVEYVD